MTSAAPVSSGKLKKSQNPSFSFGKENIMLPLRSFTVLLFCCLTTRLHLCSSEPTLLEGLHLDGNLSFHGNEFAAMDFGNQTHSLPLAVLYPGSVRDVAKIINYVWKMGPGSNLTVAARGNAHSIQGQAQADQGIVINMQSLGGKGMQVHAGKFPYVDVSGGELWINILQECVKFGLAPKSWTDYLYLTVGGTLSNAGVSGQAFRHGPEISNVNELEVVTGKGEVVTCSDAKNADLFYGVLGGLGHFGVITRARISLEPAPQKVKWIKADYSDFSKLSRDQEHLISAKHTFDYIEGLVSISQSGRPQDSTQADSISDGRRVFTIELAKYFNPENADEVRKEIKSLLSQLSYIPSTLTVQEVSYVEFLNRVHKEEQQLRSLGLWEVPHAWQNLAIPRSKIHTFVEGVFGKIVTDTNHDPVIIYPVNKSKWDNRTSFVLPDEEVFYMVALLFHANPSSTGTDGVEYLLNRNKKILDFCEANRLGAKQYLAHYTTKEEWKAHFGQRWEVFSRRKSSYDPLAILAPGQRIFLKAHGYM